MFELIRMHNNKKKPGLKIQKENFVLSILKILAISFTPHQVYCLDEIQGIVIIFIFLTDNVMD